MASKDANGLERWRGTVTAQLDAISQRLEELRHDVAAITGRFESALQRHADEDKRMFDLTGERVNNVEHAAAKSSTKLAVVVAVLAAIFTGVVDAVARSYFSSN